MVGRRTFDKNDIINNGKWGSATFFALIFFLFFSVVLSCSFFYFLTNHFSKEVNYLEGASPSLPQVFQTQSLSQASCPQAWDPWVAED